VRILLLGASGGDAGDAGAELQRAARNG
jgi:hypothetical protein